LKLSDRQLQTVRSLQAIERDLGERFVGRASAIKLMILAVVSQEHMLLIGPPGTAKTDLIRRFSQLIQARQFNYLLTRFTEPAEIFGPLDFELFQKGTYQIKSEEMLPAAEVVFLDEVFQGSSAILNTLLTLINERRFYNGSKVEKAPLISMFGASSEFPDDPALQAFSDRFLLRLVVEPVGATRLTELLDRGWAQERVRARPGSAPPLLAMKDLTALSAAIPEVDLQPVRAVLSDLISEVLAGGITLSDRRIVRAQKLIAAAALLREDGTARPRDLWPLAHFWTEQSDAVPVREAVDERVTADGGEPVIAQRSPAELEALARYEADLVLARQGAVPRGSVVATLRTINVLLNDARAQHPGAHPTHDVIRIQRDRVSQLLDQHD
jgi:MoxR-like ATPase